MPACCHDPAHWKTGPDPHKRPGWQRVTCGECGRFIGYRDPKAAGYPKP